MDSYRAQSLFQPSNFAGAVAQTLNDSGECIRHLYGSIMSFPHTVVARTVSVLGFDYVMIDALHTAIDAENLIQLVQTINFTSEGKTIAIVRVPSADSHLLTHALDAGAGGIVFPHIDTAEEAKKAVQKCRYACSGGKRSLSPSALLAGITDMADGTSHEFVADKNIAVICQIESSLSVKNAEEIASVPGVNVLMIGAGDLRLSLGISSKNVGGQENPIFVEAVNQVIQVSKKLKIPLMAVAFKVSEGSMSWMRNFALLLSSADIYSVVKGHQSDIARLKQALEQ
ncbi:4-hydroxy-2-oxovalerate aldolase [Golovinomyces cichoracearum]|uniref:4-hydroxy-2-oxovalerate aldolase n=1 Tax=Golovinomyces cichoracearum TaxID=62708 RepID=A0A420J1K1_9PEZI|nr:4-hydroxy-2-oxovalerate aldolase [Golovinomyces cichoracearum]RKF80702.1 4-hydroxy-2-oxovalerate aldolase [Golovinomyces cichoracearum]